MKLGLSRQILEKCSNIKFREYPTSESRVVPYRQKDGLTDGQTDMTKLIVVFRIFAKAHRQERIIGLSRWLLRSQDGTVPSRPR